MKRLAMLLLSAAVAGCSSGSVAETRSNPAGIHGRVDGDPGTTGSSAEPVEISIDTGDRDLGAYTIALVYDNTLVRVVSVEPSTEFPAPQFLRRDFTSGSLVLSGFRMEQPYSRGRISLARVTFEALGKNPSQLTVRLLNLYDPEARPIKGRTDASRDRVP